MKLQEQLNAVLPEIYSRQICVEDLDGLEEIRAGCGRPLRLKYQNRERDFLPMIQRSDVEEIIQRACRNSAYAYSEMIAQGYLTFDGGHRIGICGTGVLENGKVQCLRDVTSVNIRICRDITGIANPIVSHIFGSVLILGPPGSGKTTLLRDLVRQISDQKKQFIGLADDRGEVSFCGAGCQFSSLGTRTDVLVHIPKKISMMMLLRTMGPSWIATDEITSPADIDAMEEISYCGIHLIATAHGSSRNDLYQRPLYRKLVSADIFKHLILMKPDKTMILEDM